ncbi:MAG: UDP-2,4-diacetamido-2,4,6-trideoxy-beta-L-altropyranose hydrolase [Deltaproteobacteria bacterium]|nr:UDP-2,4-diacetamido-2,4,6-trideoxy-beta-L-altropyranose hydrolase [Deltaproteobacteria bacterium]
MPNALFRCDGGARIGIGHVTRCGALAAALEERGWRCWFATTRETAPLLSARRAIIVPAGSRGAKAVARVVSAKQIDCLVVDHYGLDAAFERAARATARMVVVIDDLGDRPHDCDVIVDPGPLRRVGHRAGRSAGGARLLSGLRHALLRQEIADLRRGHGRRRAESRGHLLVTMGGADPAGLSGSILAALPADSETGLRTVLVVGPANRQRGKLVGAAAARGLEVVVDPPDLPRRMAAASLVITAGGTTCWELACLGVPAIVAVAAENQRRGARAMRRAGAGIVFEDTSERAVRGIAAAVRRLARDHPRRRRMASAGRRLVDGRGAARVAQAVTRMLTARREGERS